MRFLTFFLTLFFSFKAIGTMLHESTTIPPLYEAVKKSDYDNYSKEMERLLNGPVEDFITALAFVNGKGDSILHLIIEAQKNQKQFAQELASLLLLMTGQKFSLYLASFQLGGRWINIPKMEETALGQAILFKKKEEIKKLVHNLLKGPTIDIIRNFYSSSFIMKKNRKTVLEYISKNYLSQLDPQLYKDQYNNPSAKGWPEPKTLKLSGLLRLAQSVDNLPAYFALKQLKNEQKNWENPFSVLSHSLVFVSTFVIVGLTKAGTKKFTDYNWPTVVEHFFPSLVSFDSLFTEHAIQILLSSSVATALSLCHSSFKKKRGREKRTLANQ